MSAPTDKERVRSDIAAIREAFDRGNLDPPVVVGLQDRRASRTEPAFIGRAEELSQLKAQIAQTRAGEGRRDVGVSRVWWGKNSPHR